MIRVRVIVDRAATLVEFFSCGGKEIAYLHSVASIFYVCLIQLTAFIFAIDNALCVWIFE
jgi:hypothetical protein